ncbi:DMT family transporter [Rubrivirga sp. IMCC45206]|uniref:DMT family transporter n=1 Tax=Rubrivirga sp. IMCC45206 TaxID=3391614 RepID=UPI00399013C2
MAAFAANSVLARLALTTTDIDAGVFTAVRVAAGALALLALVGVRRERVGGSWGSAAALVAYAGFFSIAYLRLPTGAGALVLFGAVQLTMIGWGVARGERPSGPAWLGIALAFGGLVALVAPGLTAPPLAPALAMAASGAAWGAYSLRGRGSAAPTADTAGNFARAVPLALVGAGVWALLGPGTLAADGPGLAYAVASGALTSGLGYALWYRVLPALRAATAATVQLSVPVLAALGGLALVGEPVTLRLAVAGAITLGGIALVARAR